MAPAAAVAAGYLLLMAIDRYIYPVCLCSHDTIMTPADACTVSPLR